MTQETPLLYGALAYFARAPASRIEHDRHANGLLDAAGLAARSATLKFSDRSSNEVFTGLKR